MRIDEKYLLDVGFKEVEPLMHEFGRKTYQLKFPFYNYQFRLSLGDYPSSNPNCGVLGLYEPEEDVEGVDLRGKKKIIKYPEFYRPIAWYVDTPNRLHSIIQSLTHKNL